MSLLTWNKKIFYSSKSVQKLSRQSTYFVCVNAIFCRENQRMFQKKVLRKSKLKMDLVTLQPKLTVRQKRRRKKMKRKRYWGILESLLKIPNQCYILVMKSIARVERKI